MHPRVLFPTVILATFFPAIAAGQVLLPIDNAGFEQSSPGDPPLGWTPVDNFFWTGNSSMAGADPGGGYQSSQFISASWSYGGLPDASSLDGGDANTALIYQDIDLSPYSEQISQGDRYLGVSYAFFHNDDNDLGTISYDFLDAGNSAIGGGYNAQTETGAGWRLVDDAAAAEVPAGAAKLRISLGAQRPGFGTQRNIAFDAIGASLQPPPPPETPTGLVNGNLIQFDSDGNWTWYTDERSVVDPNNGRVLINSVGFDETVGGSYPGQVDVVEFDTASGRRVRTTLSNQQPGAPVIQNDDHNVGALLVLPDGRYLTLYSNHGNTGGLGDEWTRWRVSDSPGDSTSWSAEKRFNWFEEVPGVDPDGNPDAANVSYHNLFYLSEEDQVYNISRSFNQAPNIQRYDPATNELEWAGQLADSVNAAYSTGYFKYASNGADRIYFTHTETHPRNFNNSIYAGYIENGQSFDLEGALIDANVFDSVATAGEGAVPDATDFTLVQQSNALGDGYNRLWTTDTALDSAGAPLALYTSRWNPDGSTNDGSTNNPIDHRLHFARWNAATKQWDTQEVAKMGGRLYGPEQDYTGLGALVPGDENTLYISTPFDPRDPTGETETANHEIYRGVYAGDGWAWTAITENSSVDNLRPIVPDNHGAGPRTVIWFRGDYNTAHDINAAVVGIVDGENSVGLVNYVDANGGNTTFANGAPLTVNGPSSGVGPQDSEWHERTGFGNGDSVLTSNESGTEDAPMLRTSIEGLEDGEYDVFAYFWSDNDEDWRLLAGLEEDNLIDFRRFGSQHAEQGQFASIDKVADNNNDLLLYRAYLGRSDVVGESPIEVFIDDWQAIGGDNSNRTWYDGVGYAPVTAVLPGDYNSDGVVDVKDYAVWRDNLGAPAGTLPNDVNEGAIGSAQYATWREHFGERQALATTAAESAVPEPGSLWLIGACGAMALRRSNGARKR